MEIQMAYLVRSWGPGSGMRSPIFCKNRTSGAKSRSQPKASPVIFHCPIPLLPIPLFPSPSHLSDRAQGQPAKPIDGLDDVGVVGLGDPPEFSGADHAAPAMEEMDGVSGGEEGCGVDG
jgi:hypothetical protein